jgi:hypothetical protein
MKLNYSCALATLTIMAVAATGGAQTMRQISSKTLQQVFHWSGYDSPLDAAVDSNGDRYVVGYHYDGSIEAGYLVKMSKKGFVDYRIDLFPGSSSYSSAVAVDTMGHVFVGTNHNNTWNVDKYDTATGNLLWQSNSGYDGAIYDLSVNSNGNIFAATSADVLGTGAYYPFAAKYTQAGAAASGWYLNQAGAFLSCDSRDSDASGFFCGYTYDAVSLTDSGRSMFMPDNLNTVGIPTSDPTTDSEIFSKVVVDQTTGVAAIIGSSFSSGIGSGQVVFGAHTVDWDGANKTNESLLIVPSGFGGGAAGSGLAVDPLGRIYLAYTYNTASGTPGVGTALLTATPGSSSLAFNWERDVPATDTGTWNVARGLTIGPDGPILVAASDLVSGSSPNTFSGLQVYTFGNDGSSIDRQIYGGKNQQNSGYYLPYNFTTATIYDSGFLSIIQPTVPLDSTGVFTGQYDPGPDDHYSFNEDSSFHVGLAKSLLNNDGNELTLSPLTSVVVSGSASAGIQTLTVNPNGSFDVTPVPNFNGTASFNYKVKQNGSAIAIHHVTLNIRPQNDAPHAVNDSFNVGRNSAVQNLVVLGNDTDADGDNLVITAKTNNTHATIGITANHKYIKFKPDAGFTGDVTFTYTIKDSHNVHDTATVTVHVS